MSLERAGYEDRYDGYRTQEYNDFSANMTITCLMYSLLAPRAQTVAVLEK